MYLKSIEVHGFKAFANKILFTFDQGITGIVGPNGSGKSNVADAVRWVLGEQSPKQLRGSSMQDVIFAGTENRKPMGFAYVSLTLDNSDHGLPVDYDEVTVGRRVYRSGESEYLLNGTVCRLRDVQELFFDTGIGKEGYSIIGQGQIDKILSGKPEERREIFDEAAGITKYKKRKTAAERDLETERDNLTRISDIVSEIEKQLGPLEKQNEKAKIYLGIKEELKKLEVNLFLLEYERSADGKKELEDKLRTAEESLSETKDNYEKAKEDYDRLLEELEYHRNELQKTRDKKTEILLRTEQTSGEINLLNEQIATIENQERTRTERLGGLEKKKNELTEELRDSEIQRDTYRDQLASLKEEQERAEALMGKMKADITALVTEEKDVNEAHIRLLSDNAALTAELERYNTLLEQQNISKAELNAKLLRFKTDADAAEQSVRTAEETLKEVAGQVSERSAECDKLDGEINELTTSIRVKTDAANEAKQHFIESNSKLEALSNMAERYEGYGNAVRKVMEQKKEGSGIHGVVADLISVPEKYETAIETAIGGNFQNVVVDDIKTAKRLIDLLKTTKQGRATFLPLTDVTAKKEELQPALLKKPGVLGIASELIDCEPVYREVVRYLVGRYLVVDTFEHADAIAKEYRQSVRMVTLGGEHFQPGGAVSGGAYRNNSNVLGRKREVEELRGVVEKKKIESDKLEQEGKELRAKRETLRSAYEEKKNDLQKLYVEMNTAKINLNHITEQNRDLLGTRESLRNDLAAVEESMRETRQNQTAVSGKIAANTELSETQKKRAAEIAGALTKLRDEEDSASADAVRVLTEYSGLEQNFNYRTENCRRLENELAKLAEETDGVLREQDSVSEELTEKYENVSRLEAEKKGLTETTSELESRIEEIGTLADDITKQNKGFFETREKLASMMGSLDKEVYRLQSQQEKMAEQLEAQTNYMWDEYQITYNAALEYRDTGITNPAVTRKQVYETKQKIKALGDVNVGAIEEYRETKERYEFLTGQKKDIEDAEKQLVSIINELENQMRKQFTATFGEVQKRFDKVFKELFGGGKGTLELTEDEDVLEAGIQIIAQPPGKKLQNMMQLSGGEKALTAISLLFAILDLKPSPFCLLDEIEAALDDSNVSRFANYLHKLTKNTQFIVITHRRGTMAAADALYGITMQEKGISTLVSVSLIENELDK